MRLELLILGLVTACEMASVERAPVASRCAFNRVGAITVTGAPREAVPQLVVLEGTIDDPERTARIAQTATGALRSAGYVDARLAITRRVGCRVDLDVAVALGTRYRIADIVFETDDEFPAAERLAAIEDALGTVNTVGGIYVEYRLARALVELERRYRDAGWLDARLGPARASYDAAGKVAVAIPVSAGRRFRIASVTAVGVGPSARAEVLQTLGLRAGDYYDGPSVRAAIDRARHKLARWVELRTHLAEDRPEIELEAIVEARR